MILSLSSESVRNTTFSDERGCAVFKSTTPFRLGTRTTSIARRTLHTSGSDPTRVVGRISWPFFGSSVFSIGGVTLASNVFLPKKGFFARKRAFVGPDGRRYRWDVYQKEVALSLDEGSQTELARYHRATRGEKRTRAYLEIAPEAEHMLTLVILTFVYLEKLRMDKETGRWMMLLS